MNKLCNKTNSNLVNFIQILHNLITVRMLPQLVVSSTDGFALVMVAEWVKAPAVWCDP